MTITEEMLYENAEKAAILYLDKTDAEYQSENEHVFSGRFERNMRKMIKDQKRSPGQRRFISIMQKAAIVLLIALAGAFATTMSVKAYREEFINFIKRTTHRATNIEYRIGDVEYCEVDLNKTAFGYLPQGFEITEQKIGDEEAFYTIRNSDGGTLYIDLYVVTDTTVGVLSINTENTEVSYPTINGEKALLSIETEGLILVCSQRNVICKICGIVSEQDAVRIAENISLCFEKEQ
jgi:hypothetical protein